MMTIMSMLKWMLLLSAAAVVHAQEAPPPRAAGSITSQEFFKANNIARWPRVLQIAGLGKEVDAPEARYAALIPTDTAVDAFLASMGLDMASLAARPQLAKHMLAQHLVLAIPPEAQQELLDGRSAAVLTAASSSSSSSSGGGGSNLTTNQKILFVAVTNDTMQQQGQQQQQQLDRLAGRVKVTDSQGQVATAVKLVRLDANKLALVIDKVLQSAFYYPNFASLCKHRATQAGLMCKALTNSGALKDPSSPKLANTVFMPGPKAFQQADIALAQSSSSSSSSSNGGGSSSSSQSQLQTLVKYHVVPGLHALPDGLENGASYNTMLPGAQLMVEYSGNPVQVAKSKNDTLVAYVISADKQRVPIAVHNVFVGQGIIHGIPSVLLPPQWPSSDEISSMTSPKSAQSQQQQQQQQQQQSSTFPQPQSVKHANTVTERQHRRLLGGVDTFANTVLPLNAAETRIRAQTRSMFREAEERWS